MAYEVETGATNCSSNDNYIMSVSPSLDQNRLNIFKFSSCSINQLKSRLLLSNGALNSVSECLSNSPTNMPNETVWAERIATPGLIWSADDQCKMLYGNQSSFCSVCLII
jgi:hypothetical protein